MARCRSWRPSAVEWRKIRRNNSLHRRLATMSVSTAPAQYSAWMGVRFLQPTEDRDEPDQLVLIHGAAHRHGDRFGEQHARNTSVPRSGATRALTGDLVEMEFLTDDPVAQAVTYRRVTFDARAPRCGRYGCATAGRVSWT
jgi:hypothetical protein